MNALLIQVIQTALPPEMRAQLQQVFEQLTATGRAETVLDVPGQGRCKITIEKEKES